MTDAEYIKIIEQLNREMIKAMDSMLEACNRLKELDKPKYDDWIAERLK